MTTAKPKAKNWTRTDNHNPLAKLDLRRHFLDRYHAGTTPRVFDCCQGSGVIWGRLRAEYPVSYWGVDKKPSKGRLKVDSVRVLSQPGWAFDVVDVDTYGEPWAHWDALLPRVTGPLTVFLTCGLSTSGGGGLSDLARSYAGLGFRRLRPPSSVANKFSKIIVSYALTRCCDYNIVPVEVTESVPVVPGLARYFGLRLEPRGGCGAGPRTPGPADTPDLAGVEHVRGPV